MDEDLRKTIESTMREHENSSIDELNRQLKIVQDRYNNAGQDRFDGLSPEQMRGLLYGRWGENLITINPKKYDGNDIPIIKQIKYFVNVINDNHEIKLTKAGNIPPAIVKEIYAQQYITDYMIETGITKLTKETDVNNIVMMKTLCTLAGLVKVYNNKLSLTKKAAKVLNSNDLFEYLFEVTCNKYNWAYFDSFINEDIGQLGYNYTLYLINKYGAEWKGDSFYADLYFKAFEHFKDNDEYYLLKGCYIHRALNQILKYYGLIEFENKKIEMGNIRKTELFEKYIIVPVCP
jgi:hypothetical protein